MSDDLNNQASQEPQGWVFEQDDTDAHLSRQITDKMIPSKEEEIAAETDNTEPVQSEIEQQATQPVSVKTDGVEIDAETGIPTSNLESANKPQDQPKKQFLGMLPFERFMFILLVLLFLVIVGLLFLYLTGNLSFSILDGLFN